MAIETLAPPEPAAPVLASAEPLRVLHVGKYYPPVPGGMERVLQLLCERERERVACSVLVAGTDRHTRHETVRGVRVTRAGSLAMVGSVGLSPALPMILRRTPADVTVIHEPNPMALLADAVTRRRGGLVVYFHSEVVRPQWKYRLLYRPFLARVLDRADRILVASPAMRDTALQLEGYRHKCVVVPYGIEPAALARTATTDRRARDLRARARGPLLLFVGRLVPYKGVDVLIRAMRSVDAHLVVIGDGPLRAALEGLATDTRVGERVTFAGAVDDNEVLAHYHACDALVLPSVTRAEAFGMVQIEAMACGKPVVSTDLPSGVPWVNQHRQSGLVVPPSDVEALSVALQTLTRDAALREALGAGARRRVTAEFTAERMAGRTMAMYEEIVAERAGHARR